MIAEIGVIRQYSSVMRIKCSILNNNSTLSILCRNQSSKINSVHTICPIGFNHRYQNTYRTLRPYSHGYDKIVQIQQSQNLPKESNRSPHHIYSRSKHTPPLDEEILRTPREAPDSGEEPPKGTWKYLAGAAAVVGIIGSVYYFQSSNNEKDLMAAQKTKWMPRPINRFPEDVSSLPDKVKYVLIGGGTASFAAFRAIKSSDPKAKILVISAEDSYPYMRPPLSKEVWLNDSFPKAQDLSFIQWNGNRRSLYYESPAFYLEPSKLDEQENGGVAIALGHKVESVDARARTITVQGGKVIQYDKCLIATGVRAKNIPVFEQAPKSVREKTFLLRNIRDLELLWHRLAEAKNVLIVGGSFLGSELACALGRKLKESGTKVTQVYEESGNMAHILPDYLSQWTTDKVRNEGVHVVPNAQVLMVMPRDGNVEVSLSNGEFLETDLIVVGAGGSEPNVELAATSQLEVHPEHGGFLVNAELEARTDLYVAGDVACFYDALLGRRRVEHHDHAVVSGRLAGENMTGAAKPYTHQSMFWSDLGPDVGYEAIGIIDSSLPTTAVFATPSLKEKKAIVASVQAEEPSEQTVTLSSNEKGSSHTQTDNKFEKGVIFYTRDKKIVGILLWNVFNRMHLARQILAQNEVYEDLNEVAKLFKLHETQDE